MAVTQIQVCNSALIKVGADIISSIDQDTKRANLLKASWDLMRDETLRAHPWHFATRRATLAPTSTTPAFEWDYTFDVPSDVLRVWDLYPGNIDFVRESENVILCNDDSIDAILIYRCEDPSLWDSCFAEAFAWKLAWQVSYALTQSSKLQDTMLKGYLTQLKSARTMNGAEGTLKGLIADTWTNSRR